MKQDAQPLAEPESASSPSSDEDRDLQWRSKALGPDLLEILELTAYFHGALPGDDEAEIERRRKLLRKAIANSYTKYIKDAPPEELELFIRDLQSESRSDIKDRGKVTKTKVQAEHRQPSKEEELSAIQQRVGDLIRVSRAVDSLHLSGADVQVQVAGLHELAGRCENLSRNLGMQAVSDGQLTQRDLSRLLGVHELTIHRWVKAAQEQPAEQDQ